MARGLVGFDQWYISRKPLRKRYPTELDQPILLVQETRLSTCQPPISMKTRIYLAFLGLSLLAVSSCSRGADPVTGNCEAASRKSDEFTKAANAYASSQTKANCEAYKRAATDFINAADRCADIPQSQISQARQSINSLTCQ
jgi:hypothetical protein